MGMIKELRALCKAACTRTGHRDFAGCSFFCEERALGSCCKLGCGLLFRVGMAAIRHVLPLNLPPPAGGRLLLMFQADSKAACTSQIQDAGCFLVFGMAATPIRRRERMRGRLRLFWPAPTDRRAMWTAAASVAGCVRRRGRARFRPFWAA